MNLVPLFRKIRICLARLVALGRTRRANVGLAGRPGRRGLLQRRNVVAGRAARTGGLVGILLLHRGNTAHAGDRRGSDSHPGGSELGNHVRIGGGHGRASANNEVHAQHDDRYQYHDPQYEEAPLHASPERRLLAPPAGPTHDKNEQDQRQSDHDARHQTHSGKLNIVAVPSFIKRSIHDVRIWQTVILKTVTAIWRNFWHG